MKKIRNYNPNLGLTLNDIKMLLALDEADDFCCNRTYNLLDSICESVDTDTTFSYKNAGIQRVYDFFLEKVRQSVDEYERQLIEQGYTQEDIDEYHTRIYERNNKQEE